MSTPAQLVQKLGNYSSILRDDGLSSGDYVRATQEILDNLAAALEQFAIHRRGSEVASECDYSMAR